MRVRLGASTFALEGGTSLTLTQAGVAQPAAHDPKLKGLRLRVALEVVDAASNRATSVQRVRLSR